MTACAGSAGSGRLTAALSVASGNNNRRSNENRTRDFVGRMAVSRRNAARHGRNGYGDTRAVVRSVRDTALSGGSKPPSYEGIVSWVCYGCWRWMRRREQAPALRNGSFVGTRDRRMPVPITFSHRAMADGHPIVSRENCVHSSASSSSGEKGKTGTSKDGSVSSAGGKKNTARPCSSA